MPQGSVLGPLLFLVQIGDIDATISFSSLKSFADDTRVTKAISNVTDASQLQTDLNSIYEWADSNGMSFNSSKFELVRYGNDEIIKSCTNYTSDSGTIIDTKHVVKDLGILISDDCKFDLHIDQVAENVKKLCGWILRTFESRSPQLMITLWKVSGNSTN